MGVLVVALGACSSSHNQATSKSGTTIKSAPRSPSSSAVPATIAPPAVSTCGAYYYRAVTGKTDVGLASCAGFAGGKRLPRLSVHTGDVITIRSAGKVPRLTSSAPEIVAVDGDRLIGRQAGTSTITAHNAFCLPVGNSQPRSCPLLAVIVD